jgi:hypothetical protein
MLKKKLSESRKFAAAATDTNRLIYVMILPHVDRAGRLEADPTYLAGVVFTRLGYRSDQIQDALSDLERVGLVQLYDIPDPAGSIPVLQMISFLEHNKPHGNEPESSFPPRPTVRISLKRSTRPQRCTNVPWTIH